MTPKQREKCREIFQHYGAMKQRRQLIEECAELIQAISKLERALEAGDKVKEYEAVLSIREEVADVEIMLQQIKNDPQTVGTNNISRVIDYKLDRQIRRIENEREGTGTKSN